MEILQVVSPLVCTSRVRGLDGVGLRVLKDRNGKLQVATDPVGCRPGNWVYTISGSAARWAMGSYSVLTDLTIGGIIDNWIDDGDSDREQERAAGTRQDNRV